MCVYCDCYNAIFTFNACVLRCLCRRRADSDCPMMTADQIVGYLTLYMLLLSNLIFAYHCKQVLADTHKTIGDPTPLIPCLVSKSIFYLNTFCGLYLTPKLEESRNICVDCVLRYWKTFMWISCYSWFVHSTLFLEFKLFMHIYM